MITPLFAKKLFNRHRFGKVSGLIDVLSLAYRHVISQQLEGYRSHPRLQAFQHVGQVLETATFALRREQPLVHAAQTRFACYEFSNERPLLSAIRPDKGQEPP